MNNGGAQRGAAQHEPPKDIRRQRAEPDDTSDGYANRSTTAPSVVKRSSRSPVSTTELPSAALQSAYDRGSELAYDC